MRISSHPTLFFPFFFNDTAPTEIYTLSLHDALPISARSTGREYDSVCLTLKWPTAVPRSSSVLLRSEEHTSELQSLRHLVCRLLLEKKKIIAYVDIASSTPVSTDSHL